MISKKTKNIIAIFTFVIMLFLINNVNAYAEDTTCTYSVLSGQYNLTYTITPDGREGANVTDVKIENGTSTNTMKFADGGNMVTSANFVDNSKKTIGCPSMLYYEVGYNAAGRYTYLRVSATEFDKSLGTVPLANSTNNGQSIALKEEDNVKLLRSCRVTGRSATGTGGKSDVVVKVYSDGTLKAEAVNNGYNVVMASDITFEMFKDSCPTDKIVLLCGGSGSDNYCNLTTEDNTINQPGSSTKEEDDLNAVEEKNGSRQSEHGGVKSNDSDINCEGLLGSDVMDDINEILGWIKIAVPILIIILGSLDFGKAVIADDQKALSKATSTFIKRLIAAVALFLAPYLIMFLLDNVDKIAGGCDIRDLYKGVIVWKI